MDSKINWFWSHRRNASLHHFSFIMHGLSNKGWLPAVKFWFDNQLVVGVPGKGCYVFYDKGQLNSDNKYKDVQKSIDNNTNFVIDFKKRTGEIFDALFSECKKIEGSDLGNLSKKGLYELYDSFIKKIMICPLITVQLWGIEACLDENYIIMKFLTRKLYEQKEDKDLKKYKDILLINEGETVAFTEKKDFYRTASSLDKPHIIELFKKDVYVIEKELENYDEENQLINNHIKKYNWINEEYVSEGWPRSKWIRLFKNALLDEKRPQEKLQELLNQFKELILKKRNVIEQLNPPENVFHSIKALSELIAQRDWTKGYVIKIFSTYRKLLKEISIRMGIDFPQILQYSYQELYDYLEKGKIISSGELIDRSKNGFAIVIKGGKFDLVTGKDKIKRLISYESVSEPFKKLSLQESFKGLPASLGKVIGRARVLDDAIKLKDFKEGEILVTYMTTIEFIPLFGKAIAIVTDEGGMSSHAAIVSREFRLPCIVGTEVATRMVKTGDLIEVDANNGVVRIIERDKTLYSED